MNINALSIILIIVFGFLGALLGFGKGLKFFTHGIIGKILAIVVTYFLFGIVLSWPFVNALIAKFVAILDPSKWYFRVLRAIRIDLIAVAVVLYLFVRFVLNKIIVALIAKIMEIKVGFMKVLNRILGVILFISMLIVFTLIVFQIVFWVNGGGETDAFYAYLKGSIIRLDYIYLNNPLISIIKGIAATFPKR